MHRLRAFSTEPSGEVPYDETHEGTLGNEPKRRQKWATRTEQVDQHEGKVVVDEQRQHEVHPCPDQRRLKPPRHRQSQYGMPGHDAEYADDSPDGCVPEQEPDTLHPAEIRPQVRNGH